MLNYNIVKFIQTSVVLMCGMCHLGTRSNAVSQQFNTVAGAQNNGQLALNA
jgi:hypothetical protein